MDPEVLGLAVQNTGFAAVGIGFLTGLFFSINPLAVAWPSFRYRSHTLQRRGTGVNPWRMVACSFSP